MNPESDLQKAFKWARGRYVSGAGPHGAGRGPERAALALQTARKALAALPGLEEAAKATQEALAAQKALDSRRFAPGMESATAARDISSKALQAGRAFKNCGPVWTRGYPNKGPRNWESFYSEGKGPLRNIQEAGAFLDSRVSSSFYCDSFQDNTCGGFVAQLPSHKGRARFVAGYGFSESDNGGASFDLTRVFVADFESEREAARRQIGKAYWTPAMEKAGYWGQAAQETARKISAQAAANMAERAADKEREYQEAWQAGRAWADLKEEESGIRVATLAILAERRAAAAINPGGFFALCELIRGTVKKAWRDIEKSREKREELSDSIYGKEGRAAFCEGAELAAFPS